MRIACPPLLRTPPFPGVPKAIGAISAPRPPQPIDDRTDVAGMLDAIRTARVGGSFWAVAPDFAAGCTAVRVGGARQARALAARGGERGIVALLPVAHWSAKAAALLHDAGIPTVAGAFDPWSLLDRAARIEVPGDDELALLGLIAGITVRCTDDGRFAGHGLTEDAAGIAAKRPASLAAVAGAALLGAVRYRDCFTGEPSDIHAAIARLADWRRLIDANRAIAIGAGIAVWKRREVAQLLWNGSTPLRFARSTKRAVRAAAGAGGAIAAWPSRVPADLAAEAAAAGVPLRRVEDGFIRSVGLGSNLHPPLSIVADARGIYYDPSAPSDLETLLAEHPFDAPLLDRARRLADTIVRAGISKYSGGGGAFRIDSPAARTVLVAGQVEDDLSVRLGGGDVAGNRDLLARARAAEPDAFILFKPHPDVDAGHRAGRIDDADALRFADRVVRDVPMAALLDAVDGIHVLTSLAGYEALLRGRDVTVHGSPFYAGWGLTRDLGPALPRRTRTLTIDQLTAAALILYPRYLDPVTGLPCPPETLVHRLASQARPRETALIRARRLQGWLRRAHSPIGRLA
ncbi:beta-3-deoxy-D-manno-oct-2-ulosonic acid transferase [Sphingomonas profundi]|uniref:capsular polysaccharide export protein, LipB/KpsS family n=1 Tax=Alterirhizorhabdus profundi TaxID=2681549 RepID=UPI001E47616C|nr:beta-3-deoxy-D-manno-oct-2-ulosonic acid transferase [Sphingomonas profundi]